MVGSARMVSLSLVQLVAASSCTTVQSTAAPLPHHRSPPDTRVSDDAFVVPGERIIYEIEWFDTLVARLEQTAGHASEVDGHPAIELRSIGASDGAVAIVKEMRGTGSTIVALDTGLPLYLSGMTFDDVYSGDALDDGLIARPHRKWTPEVGDGEVAHDTHSVIAQLRGWRALEGERTYRYMKINDDVFRADAVAKEYATLTTHHGRREALRVDGVITRRRSDLTRDPSDAPYPFVVWVANDETRVPIRYHIESRYGPTVKVELVSYERPGHPPLSPNVQSTVP